MRRAFISGLFLLFPLVVAVFVLAKLFEIGRSIAEPIAEKLFSQGPYDWMVVDAATTVLLVILCILLGKLVQRDQSRTQPSPFDNLLVDYFPRYAVLKTFMQQDGTGAGAVHLPDPAVFAGDDGARIAFVIERADDLVTLYIPDAPSIWSGDVVFVPPARVLPLDMSSIEAATFLRRLGQGAQAQLPPELRG